jgi:hypothetical protein
MKIPPIWKYRFAMSSATLTLVGAFLVFRSFQATSSDFFLTSLRNGDKALCIGDNALITWEPNGVGMGRAHGCAESIGTPRVAIVIIESQTLSYVGWGLLLFGFLLQAFSIEKPQSGTLTTHASYGPRQKSPKK